MYLNPIQFQGDMSFHEKLHFFMRDIIRVKNPLSTDYRFKFDSVWYVVKAGQTKDFERYLAEKYVWNISQHIIGQLIGEMGNKAMINYSKSHPDILIDPYLENRQVWDKLPRMDDPKLQEKIVKDVIVGLVEKFGENAEVAEAPVAKLPQQSPLYKQLMDEFTKNPIESDNTEPARGISDKSLESEVTQQ